MIYLIIALLQVAMNTFRALEIKSTYDGKIFETLLYTFLGTGSWLFSSAVGIGAVILEHDWLMILVYMAGSLVGKFIGLKLQARFDLLKGKKEDK